MFVINIRYSIVHSYKQDRTPKPTHTHVATTEKNKANKLINTMKNYMKNLQLKTTLLKTSEKRQ